MTGALRIKAVHWDNIAHDFLAAALKGRHVCTLLSAHLHQSPQQPDGQHPWHPGLLPLPQPLPPRGGPSCGRFAAQGWCWQAVASAWSDACGTAHFPDDFAQPAGRCDTQAVQTTALDTRRRHRLTHVTHLLGSEGMAVAFVGQLYLPLPPAMPMQVTPGLSESWADSSDTFTSPSWLPLSQITHPHANDTVLSTSSSQACLAFWEGVGSSGSSSPSGCCPCPSPPESSSLLARLLRLNPTLLRRPGVAFLPAAAQAHPQHSRPTSHCSLQSLRNHVSA